LYYVCLSRACLGKHSRSFCLRNCENTRAGVLSAPARQQLGSRPQRHPGLVPVPAKTRVFCECFPSLHLSRACLDKCLVFSMAHKRRAFFAPFCAKTTILPRQARDKHRESTQKKDRLSKDVISYILYIIYIISPHLRVVLAGPAVVEQARLLRRRRARLLQPHEDDDNEVLSSCQLIVLSGSGQ
jgi:hypothetical protein